MKLAIIGSGISGNVLAYHLNKEHDITLFEVNDYIGGHTHTHDIEVQGKHYNVDTGFIVHNDATYPNFIQLLEELGVERKKSCMSFSVKCEQSGLEYNGNNLNSLFAQRRNLFKPSFHKMVRDILRFNRESTDLLDFPDNGISLGDYLSENKYSEQFIESYIIPMGSAIWSSSYDQMLKFSAYFFIRFFHNHGLLNVINRPDWYVIKGGSNAYIDKITQSYRDKIRLNSAVRKVKRFSTHVEISTDKTTGERFDYVFFACHSDQALNMIDSADNFETKLLSSFPYQKNDVLLHTDTSLLPNRKLAWASWNYHRLQSQLSPVAVTYNMNILQGIECPETFCVTLNYSNEIDESKIIKCLSYMHPVFTQESLDAQKQHSELNGCNRCFYAGAYWRYGFHEDGVVSALQAIEDFKEQLHNEQQNIRRAG